MKYSSLSRGSRRSFIKTSSAMMALPFLNGVSPSVGAQQAVAPKRLIFLGGGYGFTKQSFYPTDPGRFREIALPVGLKNLERHIDDLTMVDNLHNPTATNPHGGSVGYLSAGKLSVSCDQVAASYFGNSSRFPSLVLTAKENASAQNAGHGHGSRSLSWNQNGQPITGINTPLDLYKQLFAVGNQSREELDEMLQQKRSILDIVNRNTNGMKHRLGAHDKDKIDEYFQSIREIELNLNRESEWADVPKPQAPFETPDRGISGEEEIRIMFDLIISALRTDSTRVISYRLPVTSLLESLEIGISAHSMSHYGASGEKRIASEIRDQKCMELFTDFIDLLKETEDVDGSRLFDNCIVSYGSNLRTGHTTKNPPALLTGGGGNFKRGEHIMLPKQTLLSNYWLTLLNEAGVDIPQFSDSTGTIGELIG